MAGHFQSGPIAIDPLNPIHGLGRFLGVIGSVMISASLVYVPIKRVPLLSRWVPLPASLQMHVFLGMLGVVFATYHTAFGVVGNNAVIWVFWGCMLVAATGTVAHLREARIWLRLHIAAAAFMMATLACHIWMEIITVGWS